MKTNWFIDPTVESGQLIENKGNSSQPLSYPFNAFYQLMQGESSNIGDPALMPMGTPTLLHLKQDEAHKIKQQSYRFQNPANGQKIKLEFEALQAWCQPFKILVLPIALKALGYTDTQQVFIEIDINKLEKQSSLLSDNHGIALHLTDSMQVTHMIDLIEKDESRKWYIYGDINPSAYQQLQALDNVAIQTNTPLQTALDGLALNSSNEFIDVKNKQFVLEQAPIDSNCQCNTCQNHTLSYLHHLYSNTPILTIQLLAQHNSNCY